MEKNMKNKWISILLCFAMVFTMTFASSVFAYAAAVNDVDLSITAPVVGVAPNTDPITGTGYSGTITWEGNPATFAASTVYTADVSLTADSGNDYTFAEDVTVSVAGGTVSDVNVPEGGATLTCKVTFPKTLGQAITGITAELAADTTFEIGATEADVKAKLTVKGTVDGDDPIDIADDSYVINGFDSSAAKDDGTFTVSAGGQTSDPVSVKIVKKTLEAKDFALEDAKDGTVTVPHDGEAKSVTVTGPKDLNKEKLTVKYFDKDDHEVAAANVKEVGTYTVKVTVADDTTYADTTLEVGTLVIEEAGTSAKGTLTEADFTITVPEDVTYDGKAHAVTVEPKGDAVDKVGEIKVKYLDKADKDATATEEAPINAGTYEVTVNVAESEAYEAATIKASDLTIAKKALTISGATLAERAYEEDNLNVEVTAVSFGTDKLTIGKDYTATGAMADANAGDTKAATVTVTLKNDNYSLADPTYTTATVKITKAVAPVAEINVNVQPSTAEKAVSLANVIPQDAGDPVTCTKKDATGDNAGIVQAETAINEKTLTIKLDGGAATNTATIPVEVASKNYQTFTIYVNVKVIEEGQTEVTYDVTCNNIDEIYDGKAVVPSGTVMAKEGENAAAEIGGDWAFANDEQLKDAMETATKEVIFTPEDSKYPSVTTTISVTIKKATPAVVVTVGDATAGTTKLENVTISATATGVTVDGTAETVTGTIAWDAPNTTVAEDTEYAWTFTPNGDSAKNYEVVTGTKAPGKASTTPSIPGYVPSVTDPLPTTKTESTNAVQNYVKPADYEEAEAAEIKAIMDKAAEDIKNAKTAEEVKAIEAAAKEAIDKIDTAEEKAVIRTVEATKFRATSKRTTLNGKKAIKITWNKPEGVDFDGYDIYRSTKQFSGFGKTPFFTTTKQTYTNNKGLEVGKTYYYKVRAFKYVNGRKVYSEYSYKAIRTMK